MKKYFIINFESKDFGGERKRLLQFFLTIIKEILYNCGKKTYIKIVITRAVAYSYINKNIMQIHIKA